MSFPEFKIVDAPAQSANVLFDFNPGRPAPPGRWVRRDNWSLGSPEIIGAADAIEPLYGPREIEFTSRVGGSKAVAMAVQQEMARVLLNTGASGRGWLRFQLNALTKPVWFRTYRPEPGSLVWDNAAAETSEDLWDLPIVIPAEAFAYGERVTRGIETINQNPASGGNYPLYTLISDIRGDAPTPLRFRITSSATFAGKSTLMIAHHALRTDGSSTFPRLNLGGSDGISASADITSQSDAAYTGGNYRRVAFTSPPSSMLVGGNSVPPGRYRVFARVVVTDATTVATITPSQPFDSGDSAARPAIRVSAPVGSGAQYVDLGDFSFPFRMPKSAADLPAQVTPTLTLNFARTAGAGFLNLDHLIYVPISRPATLGARSVYVTTTNVWEIADRALIVDGDTSDAWAVTPSTGGLIDAVPKVEGSFPMGIPGADNLIVPIFSTGTATPADAITRNLSVTVSYYPRYLNLGEMA